jgi:Flp pilus assembly protein TadG
MSPLACLDGRSGARARGQATVEMALVLPLVVLVVAAVLQAAVLARDQVHLTRATAAAARAVMVEPTRAAALQELATVGEGLDIETVSLSGGRSGGDLVTVVVTARPTRLPLIGLGLVSHRLRERLVVRVEDS